MMVSGHKTRSVFDRYNIVSDTDLRLASQKTETYLRAQKGTVSGTVRRQMICDNLTHDLRQINAIGDNI